MLHNFTTEQGNVFETTGGDFILPNGEPVKNRSLLEALPDQHKERALAWWDQKFGGMEKDLDVETMPAGRKMTKAELLAHAKSLMEQAESMEDDVPSEGSDQANVEDLVAENQLLKAQIAAMSADSPSKKEPLEPEKDLKEKETKRPTGKPKSERGTDVLKQMGISG